MIEVSFLGIKNRRIIFNENNNNFQEDIQNRSPTLTCHWDGKLLPNSTNSGNEEIVVDRVPVVVTGDKVEKTLGVPKLTNGWFNISHSSHISLFHFKS